MAALVVAIVYLVAFFIEVGIAAAIIGGIAWLIGASLSVSAAIGFGLAVIIGRNLLASAFRR